MYINNEKDKKCKYSIEANNKTKWTKNKHFRNQK